MADLREAIEQLRDQLINEIDQEVQHLKDIRSEIIARLTNILDDAASPSSLPHAYEPGGVNADAEGCAVCGKVKAWKMHLLHQRVRQVER